MLIDLIDGKGTPHTPVWFMRQAGRYMSSYRKLKEKYNFLQLCKTPELAARVTLSPIEEFAYDAAILFSDILIPFEPMGLDLSYNPSPFISNPIRARNDLKRLRIPNCNEYEFIQETIKIILGELNGKKDLIGFSAAPFTLVTYMIEGRAKSDFSILNSIKNDEFFSELVKIATQTLINYAQAQIEAGIKIFQIFDTWAGLLSKNEYEKLMVEELNKIIDFLHKHGVKVIYFFKDGFHLIEEVRKLNCDVISVDSSHTLLEFDELLGKNYILQGNLDSKILFEKPLAIKKEVDRILKEGKSLTGHIFNLGHGILPDTPISNVKFIIDYIHENS